MFEENRSCHWSLSNATQQTSDATSLIARRGSFFAPANSSQFVLATSRLVSNLIPFLSRFDDRVWYHSFTARRPSDLLQGSLCRAKYTPSQTLYMCINQWKKYRVPKDPSTCQSPISRSCLIAHKNVLQHPPFSPAYVPK